MGHAGHHVKVLKLQAGQRCAIREDRVSRNGLWHFKSLRQVRNNNGNLTFILPSALCPLLAPSPPLPVRLITKTGSEKRQHEVVPQISSATTKAGSRSRAARDNTSAVHCVFLPDV